MKKALGWTLIAIPFVVGVAIFCLMTGGVEMLGFVFGCTVLLVATIGGGVYLLGD